MKRSFASRAAVQLKDTVRLRSKFEAAHQLRLSRDRDRVPLLVPADLSLRTNRQAVLELLEDMRKYVLGEGRRVFLHFDHAEMVEPAAAMMLVAECFRCMHLMPGRGGATVRGNYPKSREVFRLLKEMGFFRLLNVHDSLEGMPKPERKRGRPLFLPFLTGNRVLSELAASFADLVEEAAFKMEPKSKRRMVAALKEAMGNAHEHAYAGPTQYRSMPNRWWLAGYLEPHSCEMMFMVYDQGIGIPANLSPTTFEAITAKLGLQWNPSDGKMIAAATMLRRSSTGDPMRGMGFPNMKAFVDICDDGELRVLSNRGSYTYVKGQETTDDDRQSINGTLIEWRVRHGSTLKVDE